MSNAVSVRLEAKKSNSGQAAHDLRAGKIPAYVDQERSHLNVTLVDKRMTDSMIRKDIDSNLQMISSTRTKNGFQKQSWQKKSNLVITGLITFGTEFNNSINKEDLDDCAMRYVQKFSDKYKTKLLRLVRHEDEFKTHYHFSVINQNAETGRAVSGKLGRGHLSEQQDIIASEFSSLGFERGISKESRLKREIERQGLNPDDKRHYKNKKIQMNANVIHKSVKDLHDDLPREIEVLVEKIAKTERLKAKAEADFLIKKDKSEQLEKRIKNYTNRLRKQKAEFEQLQKLSFSDIQKEYVVKTGFFKTEKKKLIEPGDIRSIDKNLKKREQKLTNEIHQLKMKEEESQLRIERADTEIEIAKDNIINRAKIEAENIVKKAEKIAKIRLQKSSRKTAQKTHDF